MSKDYIRTGAGMLVATENTSGWRYYLSFDHLGTVRLVTDAYGFVVGRHDYLPFGEEVAGGAAGRDASSFGPRSPEDSAQKFTGQVRHGESGMDYFNARNFTAGLGRFNSSDPGKSIPSY